MARRPRFAPPGYWLHLTQRGNNRQHVFSTDADREYFLNLLDTASADRGIRISAFALMSNHFHLVAMGDHADSISLFMMDVNGQYAVYRNATQRTTGHVWQRRFYSCVLDAQHWQSALRYVEMNPVRARIVKNAEDHKWTSARAHLGLAPPPDWLDCHEFQQHWPTADHWRESLATLTRREVADLRRATRHDAALGSDSFVEKLEQTYAIQLRPRPSAAPARNPPAPKPARANHSRHNSDKPARPAVSAKKSNTFAPSNRATLDFPVFS